MNFNEFHAYGTVATMAPLGFNDDFKKRITIVAIVMATMASIVDFQ